MESIATTRPTVSCLNLAASAMLDLTLLASEYEWHAVRTYFIEFYYRRRQDMRSGIFHTWATRDLELFSQYVLQHRKTVSQVPFSSVSIPSTSRCSGAPYLWAEICFNFNKGVCHSDPCKYGRQHKCTTCQQMNHGAHQCNDDSLAPLRCNDFK